MNIWVCVGLGITLAICYKVYQKHKEKQAIKKLNEKLNNNVVVEENKEEK